MHQQRAGHWHSADSFVENWRHTNSAAAGKVTLRAPGFMEQHKGTMPQAMTGKRAPHGKLWTSHVNFPTLHAKLHTPDVRMEKANPIQDKERACIR
jgi:hypothetical protein